MKRPVCLGVTPVWQLQTLLSILAGRQLSGLTGSLLVNGTRFEKQDRRRMGFVMQDDVMFSNLTVTETLTYIAQLRLPGTCG